MTFFGKIFYYIKWQLTLASRLKAEEAEQEQLGYKIIFENPMGGDNYFTYTEDGKVLYVLFKFSGMMKVTIFSKSLAFWAIPKREKLNEFEYKRVLNRISKYASSWGDVYLNDSPMTQPEDIKTDLTAAGIPFIEHEGGIIEYTSTVEKETSRKGGFFNNE